MRKLIALFVLILAFFIPDAALAEDQGQNPCEGPACAFYGKPYCPIGWGKNAHNPKECEPGPS